MNEFEEKTFIASEICTVQRSTAQFEYKMFQIGQSIATIFAL